VLKAVTAKQHAEELAAVHEVDVQPLHTVLVILCAQVCIAQNLLQTQNGLVSLQSAKQNAVLEQAECCSKLDHICTLLFKTDLSWVGNAFCCSVLLRAGCC